MKKEKKIYLQGKKRLFKKIKGTGEKPRLAVFRSHKHIYGQLIDDTTGKTLVFASTLEQNIRNSLNSLAPKEASLFIGQILAQRAISKNINSIVFDRSNKPYHGRIKSFANGARLGGLVF